MPTVDKARYVQLRRVRMQFYRATFAAGTALAVLGLLVLTGTLSPGRFALALLLIGVAGWIGGLAAGRFADPDLTPAGEARAQGDSLQDLIAALPDAAILLAPDGRVVAFNAQATEMAPALRRGDPSSIALRVPDVVEAIRRAIVGNAPARVEFSERVPSDRWSEAVVTPVHEAGGRSGGRPAFLLLTFRDLTAIRRVEEMRVDFVANASHELRTPLAALSGFIETLKGAARNDAAARARFLDIMEAQAQRMARLIDDLLSLSRIELAAHVRPVTPVELLPLVRQVVDALQMLARDRGVKVLVEAPPQPLVVPGDRDELIRVFENLIENALKYGGSGQRVEVTLATGRAQDGTAEAVVSVRDYGPGIAAEHMPRLTERFYRVDVAGSRALGGTGLGLALAKHILNRHRGRLTIDSKAGQGATFAAHLPLVAEASEVSGKGAEKSAS